MKLVMAVLTIRLIMELITGKKTGKNKAISKKGTGKIQHPAEFELR
ncbi:hypothetical protein HB364_03405 [Pseudoflavitalea sp. X16]|nr:hypothetical protein [Paraflavitalea devenefica]NII24107.1 hypothetical protein [Paraflavitalea devenefica]